ncbi:immunoglobulin superfamily member 6 isoform X1 [Xyrichtys novacula]|nr:immunoglobulin superfamily member 6 isoform X1 [Xyrichtys novacula]
MDRSFWFSLLLLSLPVRESNERENNCLSQPVKVIWRKSGQSVVLPCNINSHCSTSNMRYVWFSFKEDTHHPLVLQSDSPKYNLNGASLHIKSLHANDSGIYHCAAESTGEPAQGKQHVALGTTLVVRDKVNLMVRDVLLWLSFALLAIYSLALVTLIVRKSGCSLGICGRMRKTYKTNSTKTRQFRDVLQEIHRRNNLERKKQAAPSADFNSSTTDEIYQNV